MDSFEWNKIAAAALAAVMLVTVVRIGSEEIFHREQTPVAGMAGATETPPAPAAEQGPSLAELLAAATPQKGADAFRKCQSCHIDDRTGKNKIGPNLWGVVGRPAGQTAGYAYSPAMAAKGGSWTFEALFTFLAGPQTAVPGTKMSFAGVRDEAERANLIAYLNSQSDNPLPLPAPPPVEAEAEAEQATH